MSVTITPNELTVNESIVTATTDETAAASASPNFDTVFPGLSAYLTSQLASNPAGDITTPQIAKEASFVALTIPAGTTVSALSLASDAAGTAFSTSVGVDSGLKNIDGAEIFLYAVDGYPNVIVGRDGGSSAPVAFALALSPTGGATGVTGASGWFVQYEALYHNTPNAIGAADTDTLLNKVYMSADSKHAVLFSDFSDVPSSNPLFAIIGPDSAGPDGQGATQIVVTSFDPNGAFDTVNVSQQGSQPGSLGSGAQHIGTGAGLRLDFVTGGNTTYTDGNDINNLTYSKHNETITDAGFTLVQTNPNNASLDLTVSAFNSNNNDQTSTFRSAASMADAASVTITGVLVRDNAGTVIEDTRNAIDSAAIGVSGLNTGTVAVTGLLDDYSVEVFSTNPFDRLTVKNAEDSKSNDTFDVGALQYTSIVHNTDNAEVGSKVVIQDDGPSLTADLTKAETATVDETTLGAAGAATAHLGAQFHPSYGSDGAGSVALALGVKAQGVDSGLVDTATGTAVVLNKVSDTLVEGRNGGGDLVLALTLASNGDVTLTQSRAVVHPDTNDSNDAKGFASADLVTLSGVATDKDLDTSAASTINIAGLFTILDDGPTLTVNAGTASLTTDESFIAGIGSGLGAAGAATASTAYTSFFTAAYGNDGAGSLGGYALGIKAEGQDTGLVASVSGEKVVLHQNADGSVVGRTELGLATVFTLATDGAGSLTLTQSLAVKQGTPDTPTDTSEASASLAADLITLSATVTDKEGDHDSKSANIGNTLFFKDDGPTIGGNKAYEADFTHDTVAADHVTGNVGGVNGADGAAVSLLSASTIAGFTKVATDDHTVEYRDSGGAPWFRFTVAANGDYDFTVLKDGVSTSESLLFGSASPGKPVETLTVNSQFGHAIATFDGVIFTSGGATPNYTNSLTKNVDDINPDALGFGIMGTSPNQASQINNNEGFLAKLDQATDNFQFNLQGIGNNAKSVHVEYWAWNDANKNGLIDGNEGSTAYHNDPVNTTPILSGSGTSLVKIDAPQDFDTVAVRFYFDATDLQNGALSGNALRQAVDNAGVRVLNFGVKEADTIPEYNFQFNMARTDADTDTTGAMKLGIHVDPDHVGVPTTLDVSTFPFV